MSKSPTSSTGSGDSGELCLSPAPAAAGKKSMEVQKEEVATETREAADGEVGQNC